jgi:hypothetical protein
MCLGLPDPLVQGAFPDPIKQKICKNCRVVTSLRLFIFEKMLIRLQKAVSRKLAKQHNF